MLLWFLKQLLIRIIVGTIVLAGVLQLVGIDPVGMGSDLLLDLLSVPDWSGDRFGSLL